MKSRGNLEKKCIRFPTLIMKLQMCTMKRVSCVPAQLESKQKQTFDGGSWDSRGAEEPGRLVGGEQVRGSKRRRSGLKVHSRGWR